MSEQQQEPVNPWVIVILAVVIGYFVLNIGTDDKKDPQPKQQQETVVIVPPVGFGASVKLDEWAEKNNVEIRRYRENADMSRAEPNVRELYELTEGNRPCAITDLGGQIEILPLDTSLLDRLESLR
jgi:hypothetical protein